jgi:hypothetical protein
LATTVVTREHFFTRDELITDAGDPYRASATTIRSTADLPHWIKSRDHNPQTLTWGAWVVLPAAARRRLSALHERTCFETFEAGRGKAP